MRLSIVIKKYTDTRKIERKMCNLPVFSKCCCCIPLRIGLVVWGYLRLIVAISYLLLLLHGVSTQFSAKGLAILLALLSFLISNVIFTITFIIGSHKKNYKLLRIYYTFNIFALIVTVMGFVILVTLQVVLTVSDEDILGFPSLAVDVATMTNIILDLYFILLIRKEILKLKSCRTYVVNYGQGETSVVLDMPVTKEQDRNCVTSIYTDSESEEDVVVKKQLFPVQELKRLKKDLENRTK